jgi:predicted ATPase
LDAIAAATRLIVSSSPHVQVLATSRQPLDIDGERTRRLLSLNLDDDGPAVTLFRLRAEEAGTVLDPARDPPRSCR